MKLNPINIFRFIESKDGRSIPIKLKIIKFHDLLTPDDLKWEGNLDLGGPTKYGDIIIVSLPNNLKV